MVVMVPHIAEILLAFDAITLETLNAKARMLIRLDQKYIIDAANLQIALEAFRTRFDILEIGGRRSFTYATQYYDDHYQRAYYDHLQGRRKRSKVRVRHYLDADLSFLEVKLKDKRDVTIKRRMYLKKPIGDLDAACADFVDRSHTDLYGEPFSRHLHPVLGMRYNRITLVAKDGAERLTIDTAMEFRARGRRRRIAADLFIIETKSVRGNGIADAILRELHIRPTKRCSKYCIGMAALGKVKRANRFLPALRRLRLLGGADFRNQADQDPDHARTSFGNDIATSSPQSTQHNAANCGRLLLSGAAGGFCFSPDIRTNDR